MSLNKKSITHDFWFLGLLLLGLFSVIILDWPHPNDRARVVIESFSFVFMGMLLPLLWNTAKKANRLEHFLLAIIMVIMIGGLISWTHFRVVTIHVVGNSHGGLESEIKEFNNAYEDSGIEVKLVYDWQALDTNERYDMMHKKLTDSDGIDIIELDGIWIESIINNGKCGLLPLDTYFEKDFAERDFLVAAMDAARHSKTHNLYAIPLYIDAGLIIYRKDFLGNLPDPVNFNDLNNTVTKLLAKLKTKSLDGIVFPGARYEGLNCMFYEMLSSLNASIIGYDGTVNINSDAVVSTLKELNDMIHKDNITPKSVLVFKEKESYELFLNGHALVLRNWSYKFLQSWENGSFMFDHGDIGITSFPDPVLGGWYLGIVSESEHPKEAWEVIKFLTRSSIIKRRATNPDVRLRRIPADIDVLSQLEFDFSFMPEIEQAFLRAKPRPRMKDYLSFSKHLSTTLYNIISKGGATNQTIKNKLDKAQKELNHYSQ
jgi:multiple sugar transport system substrate-binding protein